MGLFDLFKSKSNTTNLEPMTLPEQEEARKLLLQFGSTGKMGDFTAGTPYDFSGFNFNLSPTEDLASSQLYRLLGSDGPQALKMAQNVYSGIANQPFNPNEPDSPFSAFRRQVQRATQDASDVLNREAAITGNRFGTQISKDKADLAVQQSDLLTGELGRLFEGAQGRALQAAQGLGQLGAIEEQINQSRIAQAFNLGGVQRDIKNQEAQMKYSDFLRQRNERLSSLGGLSDVMNSNVDWGLKSLTTKSPSTFMSMLGEIIPGVGSYNTHQYGYTTNQSNMKEALEAYFAAMG